MLLVFLKLKLEFASWQALNWVPALIVAIAPSFLLSDFLLYLKLEGLFYNWLTQLINKPSYDFAP